MVSTNLKLGIYDSKIYRTRTFIFVKNYDSGVLLKSGLCKITICLLEQNYRKL